MSDLCLLAASLIAQGQIPGWQLAVPLSKLPGYLPVAIDTNLSRLCQYDFAVNAKVIGKAAAMSVAEVSLPEFSSQRPALAADVIPVHTTVTTNVTTNAVPQAIPAQPPAQPASPSQTVQAVLDSITPDRPMTGAQLYQQRLAALKAGKTYTRLPVDSFREAWVNAAAHPTYEQWIALLQQEAKAMAGGQGASRLSVLVGDSIAQWFPPEMMSNDRFWLNQGISGDTTKGVLRRLSAFDQTRPDTIHVMAGINDLRQGATDAEVINNLRLIMRQLKQSHPDAKIIVHSILPTRLAALPTDRIRRLNYAIAMATQEEQVFFLNLQPAFSDDIGILRRDLTTDGIHLSIRGYETWETVISSIRL